MIRFRLSLQQIVAVGDQFDYRKQLDRLADGVDKTGPYAGAEIPRMSNISYR